MKHKKSCHSFYLKKKEFEINGFVMQAAHCVMMGENYILCYWNKFIFRSKLSVLGHKRDD